CGSPGSPLIFIEELRSAVEAFNLKRKSENFAPLEIDCFLLLNDEDAEAIDLLKNHVEPMLGAIRESVPQLRLHVEYRNAEFEAFYPEAKALLEASHYQNVLFLLDQCGHSSVRIDLIRDIMSSFSSAEIFYTFAIQSLLAFLAKSQPAVLAQQLGFL